MSVHSRLAKIERVADGRGLGKCSICQGLPLTAVIFAYRQGDPLPPVPCCPHCGAEGRLTVFGLPGVLPGDDDLFPRHVPMAQGAER